MNAVSIADDFREAHDPHWVLKSAFQLLVFGLVLTEVMLALAVRHGFIWVAALLVIVAAHLMHGTLIGLHEAAHGLLRKNRRFNEFDGVVIGTLSLMSFSLYRVVHQTHHAYLATERDYEFWPLSRPTVSRWKRCLAAFCELNLGLFYSPFVFLRAFFSSSSPVRSDRVRRRIWAELALIVVTWSAILGAIATFGLWKYFFWMYLAPALVAANLQSWRKYIEHVGLTGDTVNGSTRSIVARSWLGRLCCIQSVARTVSRRSSSKGGPAAFGPPPVRGKIAAEEARRANPLPQLPQCLGRPVALPRRSARRATVAHG